MSREPQTLELEGVTVTSVPLPYERSEDLLPEVGQIIALALQQASTAVHGLSADALTPATLKKMDVLTLAMLLGPVLSSVCEKLGQGTLKRLAPLILHTTSAVYTDATGQKAKADLMKASERAELFNEHPEAYFPILFHAGKVTFARYFPGAARVTSATPTAL